MPINDATGSITHNTKNIEEVVKSSNAQLDSIVGSTSFSGGGQFAGAGHQAGYDAMFGDFVGMDQENLETFNNACNTYVENTQEIIKQFDDTADMEQALKGEVATATHEFIEAGKKILQGFVESIKYEQAIVAEASANWQAGAGSIAKDESSDTSTLDSESSKLANELGTDGATGGGGTTIR